MAARRPKPALPQAAPARPTPAAAARRPRHAFFLAALGGLTLAAYANSFQAGLVFDSQRVILADPRIQSDTPDNVHQIWTGDYYNGTGSSALFRPLTTLTFLWNYAILGNGPHPAGYHVVNFALHAINTGLVYWLGFLLFEGVWPAWALAALWGVHPVLTESVTNVVGRADLLAAGGILAGLLCYAKSARAGGWRALAWILGLSAAAAVAVFSKESGVVLPAALIAYDVAFRPKLAGRERALRYAAVLLPIAIFLAMRRSALAQVSALLISFGDNPLLGAGWWTARLTAVQVLARYLFLLAWPARLSADYSYNQVPLARWTDATALGALLLWLVIAGAAVVAYRREKRVFFFILLFLITVAPVSNVFLLVGSIMAERFLYLPALGFTGCVVCGGWFAYRRLGAGRPQSRMLFASVPAILLLALAARTYARNFDWRDERSLWTSAAAVSPQSYKTHQNLALVLLAQPHPDYAAALREVERAMALLDSLPDDRNMPSVYATAGRCYQARGDLARALAAFLRGQAIDRAWNEAFQQRNREEGKTVGNVGTPPLYLDLARVYVDLRQPEKALDALRYGRTIDPQPAFFQEMARTYTSMGRSGEAAISLLEGLAVDSDQPALRTELTQLYRETVPASCALNAASGGVNWNCPMVHEQLCAASNNAAHLFTAMHDPASANAVVQNAARNYACPADVVQ